jgi:hypothetical protein
MGDWVDSLFLHARTNSPSAHLQTVCNKRTFSCGWSAEDTLYLETRDYCVLLLQLLMPYGWLIPYMSNRYELVFGVSHVRTKEFSWAHDSLCGESSLVSQLEYIKETVNSTSVIHSASNQTSVHQLQAMHMRNTSADIFLLHILTHTYFVRRLNTTRERVVAGSILDVIGFFQFTKSFQSHYGPKVDSASNRNEYQKLPLGVKRGRRVKTTTSPPSVSRL